MVVPTIAQNEYDVLKYNPKPTVADQHSYVVHYDYQNRILDFPFVREDDILWTKRYLTLINLKNVLIYHFIFQQHQYLWVEVNIVQV